MTLSTPSLVADLRHVFAMLGDVLFVFDAFVTEGLLGIVHGKTAQGEPVDDIGDQMKTVEIVHHCHVEGSRGGRNS